MTALVFRILRFLSELFYFVSRSDKRFARKVIERICFNSFFSRNSGYYFKLVARPKSIDEIAGPAIGGMSDDKIGIVLQGPIVDSFTLDTVTLYRRLFPECELIVATWRGLPKTDQRAFEALGAHVELSDLPDNPGILNFNYQLTSTQSGLAFAKKIGCSKILKTRSDQRICERMALRFLNALYEHFPCDPGAGLKGRIVYISETSLARVSYHLCDMLQFGDIDDVSLYWDVKPHTQIIGRPELAEFLKAKGGVSGIVSADETVPEVYLGQNFARRLFGEEAVKNPIPTYLRLLSEATCVVGTSQLDMIWPKYHAMENMQDYLVDRMYQRISFEKWLSLASGCDNHILDYGDDDVFLG